MTPHDSHTGERLPRGPHQLTSEEVAANQRERLIDAMVQLAGTKGYGATPVADLIDRAGVSRKTFYAHFANREELLKAAFDSRAGIVFEEVTTASGRSRGGARRLEALTERLCLSATEHPGVIALCTIEIAAAGPAGVALREELMDSYAQLIQGACGPRDGPAVPAELARTLAGAFHREIDAHVRASRLSELSQLAPQLARWARSYLPVPATLADKGEPARPWPATAPNGLVGGRAPGTLRLAAASLPPMSRPSRQYIAHAKRERVLDAVAQLNAEHGYAALTPAAIAARAELTQGAFRAQYTGVEDAFAAAMELGHMKGQSIVERARASTLDWNAGVSDAIAALLEFLASEPYFARLAFVDAPLVGAELASRTIEHVEAYARLLLHGAPRRHRPATIAQDAIAHALFELVYRHAAADRIAELPRVTALARYLALAPFLGVSEAAEALPV